MKKILFPTDFSDVSLNAFSYAIELAISIKAEIVTVHVYDIPASSVSDYQTFFLENYQIMELGEFENYKSEVPKLRAIAEKHNAEHIKISHLLEVGNTIDEILKAAEKEKVDYIVMGTNGAGGIERALFGSVAEKIMNRSKVMVFVVPANCQFVPISEMLFLTQFEEHHKIALDKLLHFADNFNAHIDAIQVKDQHSDVESLTLKEWKSNYFDEDIDFKIVTGKNTEETILDFIELHHNNVVALTVKHKGLFEKLFLGSIARKMAFHSKIPVLAVPYN